MKKILLIILLPLILFSHIYGKSITTEDGFLTFEVPEDCNYTDIFNREPRKLELSLWNTHIFLDNKSSYSVPFYNLLKQDDFKINLKHIKELLFINDYLKTGDFALDPSYRIDEYTGDKHYIGYIPKSYRTIINKNIIGEEYFYAPLNSKIVNKYGGGTMGYYITFVLNDRLESISFKRIIIDGQSLVTTFPQWFEMRSDGNYYWINQDCLNEMYDLLFSEDYKKLPRDLQLIRETRDMILETVKINDPPIDTSKLSEGVITH